MGGPGRIDYGGALELRIHGVNNTSPASMLDLPPADVERVLGDDLAGFFRETAGAQDRLADPTDRGHRPDGLVREAYSWGGLARTSAAVAGNGTLSGVGRALARVGWALVLPFGVANVAYWTRRLDTDAADPEPPERLASENRTRAGVGAGGARIFALGLTALAVVTVSEVAMDLVATQCYAGEKTACDRLPGAFDVLAGRDQALRLVISALVPLALLGVLYLLSSVTRSHYERRTHADGAATDRRATHGVLLAGPRFWSGDRMVARLVKLHLAVGVAVVALVLAWPGIFGAGEACREPDDFFPACWDQAAARHPGLLWALGLSLGVAVLVLAGAAVAAAATAGDAPDVREPDGRWQRLLSAPALTSGLLAGAGAALGCAAVTLVVARPEIDDGAALLGVSAAPTLVLVLLASLALAGLTWRQGRLERFFAPVFMAAFALAAYDLVLGGLALAVAGAWLGFWVTPAAGHDREFVAWRGAGPGVFMALALVMAATLSSLLVLVAGNWLNGDNPAADLLVRCSGCVPESPHLVVARPYALFGLGVLAALLLLVAVAVAMLVRTSRGAPPRAPAKGGEDAAERMEAPAARARRAAGRAHRAEAGLALLGGLGMALLVVALVFSVSGKPEDELSTRGFEGFVRQAAELGVYALAAAGAALLAALVGAGGRNRTRPLGLVWDLVCFLPRAAHPFGPPCYAERAVPELASRCTWWLARDGAGSGRRGDRVVVSAHSLGAVLAVAAILSLPDEVTTARGRPIRLLTYGAQLRAYFGRIFPELLGPAVLGTPPVGAARLWADDPWERELVRPEEAPATTPGSLSVRLGPGAWRGLWRRTDYLGFPVWSYRAGNGVDEPAQEVDESGYLLEILTHGNYPRTQAFRDALGELARPVPGPGNNPAGAEVESIGLKGFDEAGLDPQT